VSSPSPAALRAVERISRVSGLDRRWTAEGIDAEFAAERAELAKEIETLKRLVIAERAELIEALREMINEFDGYTNGNTGEQPRCLKKARAVLAKHKTS